MPKAFLPIKIVDLDITRPLPRIDADDPATGRTYGGAFCLVRRAGRPIKVLEIPLHGKNLTAEDLKALLGQDIAARELPSLVRTPSLGEAPFISVVVATRDRTASLARCLESLLRQDYGRFDIIVVDSAPSSPETAGLIAGRYAATGRVRYVREDRPGLGQAHNRGMESVTAEIVAFTDDDVIADPHWLAAIASNVDADHKVGCVTGLILPAELETRAQFWTEKHAGFGKGFERKVYDLAEHRPPGPLFPFTAGQFGSGANMAYLTAALKRIGGFDSALGAGTPARSGDDLAAFFAIIEAGYQLVYEPEAIVWHHHRRNEDGMQRQAFGYGVGLGAYLTKVVVDEPSALFRLVRGFPAGLAHMWGRSSARMQRLPDDYPAALVWLERLGVLAGVASYIRSRAALRRDPKTAQAATFFKPS